MTINSKTRELTVQEHEMAATLRNSYDYICRKDAIRFFMSIYGVSRTVGNMVRAYDSIDWNYPD